MTYIFDERVDTRTIMGTDHPVRVVAYKSGNRYTAGILCNSVLRSGVDRKTKSAAVAAAEGLATKYRNPAEFSL